MQHSLIMVFSCLFLIIVLSECRYPTVTNDYSIVNDLDDSVIVEIYTNDQKIQESYKTSYTIGGREKKQIAHIVTEDSRRHGTILCRMTETVDSVSIIIKNTGARIAFWREGETAILPEGYENVHNWYDCQYWEDNGIRGIENYSEEVYILNK